MSRTRGGLEILIAAGDRSFGSAVVDAVETNTEAAAAECVESVAETLTRAETADGVVVDDRFVEPVTVIDQLTSEQRVPVVVLADPSEDGETVARAVDAGARDVFPRVTAGAQYELVVDRIARASAESSADRDREHEREREREHEHEREREYKEIFDGVNDAIAVFDPGTGEILDVNSSYHEMFGYDEFERIRELGIDGLSVTREGYTGERGVRLIREVAETGEDRTVEWQGETREGERVWLEATLAPTEVGGEQRVLSIQRDITERRELERTYRDIFEGVSDGLVIHDPGTGEILEVNNRYCELTGYNRAELLDESIEVIVPPDPEYTFEDALARIRDARQEGPQLFEFKTMKKSGETFIGEVHLTTIELRGTERVLASVRDITERKRREREYEQIFDGVNDAIAVFDPETGEMVEVNEPYREMVGYDNLEQIRELGIEGLSAEDKDNRYTGERGRQLVRQVSETGESETVEWRAETAGGEQIWLEVTLSPAVIRGEERVLSIQRDITERKRREREFEQIFNGVNDAIVVWDPDTLGVIDANEAYLDLLGYESLDALREQGVEGLSITEEGYTGTRGREIHQRVARTGDPETVEWQGETRAGERIWLEVKVTRAVIGGEQRTVSIQRDITERKRRERAIRALQDATEHLQGAQTPDDVATTAVDAASDALDLPVAVCWLHESDPDRLRPVAATDAAHEVGLVSELSPERYGYRVFRTGELTEYSPGEHGTDHPLETSVLLPLGEHGLVAAGTREQTAVDSAVLDVARALADHVRTALDRVERAQAVRESERRFRVIAERIDEVIYLAELDFSDVLYVNPAYEDIWGQSVEALYSDATAFLEAVDERDRERFRSEFETMLAEIDSGDPEESYEFEYRIRQPSGEVRWVHATGYVVGLSGETQRFVGIVEDITERKRREQRLEVFNRVLRHNLRNQIDVIRSHAEVLADQRDDDHADRIIAAADELAEIGTRARRTDRIMSMGETTTRVNLTETVEGAVGSLCPERAAVSVTTNVSGEPCLQTNKQAVQIAVESALENALEHAGSAVRVTVGEAPDGYTLTVDDDGPGIPEDDLAPIEAGTETTLRHGRGLGLWQLRWSVDRINGGLSFDTTDGTTVRITVPDRNGSD